MTHVNIIVDAFSGLPHKTIVFPALCSDSTAALWTRLQERLPIPWDTHLILTTNSNKQLTLDSDAPISTYLATPDDDFLPLRLSVAVCGGKGGFGSQLRAAGGRMSARKKRNQGDDHASSRNLDGRRLRTVTEAKALAEYLAIKPEMERKEKQQRRQRCEEIIRMAELREAELKRGKGGLSGKWVLEKEDARERTRDAVLAVIRSGMVYSDNLLGTSVGSATSEEPVDEDDEGNNDGDDQDSDQEDGSSSKQPPSPPSTVPVAKDKVAAVRACKFIGFDEDDEFMSSDDQDGET
jgi:hypothetical protein